MRKPCLALFVVTNLAAAALGDDDPALREMRGVVTYHLLPARVMRVNEIVPEPKPGSSVIGERSIVVHMDENPTGVMANWTVVRVQYYEYDEPRTITYELFSEQKELTVDYHAVRVEMDGDLSPYVQQ